MNTQHNALGLFGASESALLALALKYELVTGKQVKWRKSADEIYEMVKNSLHSSDQELFRKTTDFLDILPAEASKKFSQFGIEYTPQKKATPLQTYRGSIIPQDNTRSKRAIAVAPPSEQKKMWRGTAY